MESIDGQYQMVAMMDMLAPVVFAYGPQCLFEHGLLDCAKDGCETFMKNQTHVRMVMVIHIICLKPIANP